MIPFWSSKSRLEKICEYHAKYRKYEQSSLSIESFIDWLSELSANKVKVGVNWSGKKMAGYNVNAIELLIELKEVVK